jgi:hypothetical protein
MILTLAHSLILMEIMWWAVTAASIIMVRTGVASFVLRGIAVSAVRIARPPLTAVVGIASRLIRTTLILTAVIVIRTRQLISLLL